jgi:flagellar basal-body rod protein FlgF
MHVGGRKSLPRGDRQEAGKKAMVYGIYSSAAGMMTSQYRQNVLANNLANLATAGFKEDLAIVRERQPASREELTKSRWSDATLAGMTGGSLVAPTYTSFKPGVPEPTGNPLDVAITDEGFFCVRAGSTDRYTRDGRFTLNREGELVTVSGNANVLDESHRPIKVPTNFKGRVRINGNGEVMAGNKSVGQIAVVQFDDQSLLRKIGGNLIETVGAKPVEVQAALQPGAVESSNVDPTKAMVSMIEVTRAYQMNAEMVGLADRTLGRAVSEIARLS